MEHPERWIYHVDCNYCFAQISVRENIFLRGKPVACCGDPTKRNGIVMACTPEAKQFGVRTGDVIHEARQKCPRLIVIGVDRKAIRRYTDDMIRICSDYTDRIGRMGDDEAYMDVTHTLHLFGGDALKLADALRYRIRDKIGLSVSIGVSFNKIFAKLGSDLKKPFATSLITKENFREIVWPLPVSDLYFVGRATTRKLYDMGILTIGQLAQSDCARIEKRFGVAGLRLWQYANGICDEIIPLMGDVDPNKSIGNSKTAIRDLRTEEDIRILVGLLSESVAERLRDDGSKCLLVSVSLRYADLHGYQRQRRLPFATCTAKRIGDTAHRLIMENWSGEPLRGLEVRACNLVEDNYQMCILPEVMADQKQETIERTQQDIRRRFGHYIILSALALIDRQLSNVDIRDKYSAHSSAFRRM